MFKLFYKLAVLFPNYGIVFQITSYTSHIRNIGHPSTSAHKQLFCSPSKKVEITGFVGVQVVSSLHEEMFGK